MTSDEAIQALVKKGAIITMAADPNQTPVPVAWWRRISPARHFYHAAGFSDFDGHSFTFAREQIFHGGLGVAFYDKADNLTAYLTEIPEAVFDQIEAQELADKIQRWKEYFAATEYFRAGVLGNYQRNGAGK